MRIIELTTGFLGVVLCVVTNTFWSIIPLVLYGILSTFFVRKFVGNTFTNKEKQFFRKRNIVSVICWIIIAIVSHFIFNKRIISDYGLEVILFAYLFLLTHGIVMLLPTKKIE